MKDRCYLCGSKSIRFAFRKLSHDFWKCDNCGLFFLKFDYDYDKFIAEYYQKGYFTGDKKLIAYADYEGDKAIISRNMRNYLKRIVHYNPAILSSSPKLLDLGCAMGFFMEEAKKAGFDPYGLDVSEYAVSKAKKLFPNHVFVSPVENLSHLSNLSNLDVITMFDLIEHLKDPRLALQKIKKVMSKNGVLVVQTGNVSSLWARLQRKNWHFFAPPQHLHFFSRKTITDLLNQSGFEVTKIEIDGKWVSLRYLFHMMRYINRDKSANFLYNLTRHNFLGKIPILFKFGDNMIVFAKKSN